MRQRVDDGIRRVSRPDHDAHSPGHLDGGHEVLEALAPDEVTLVTVNLEQTRHLGDSAVSAVAQCLDQLFLVHRRTPTDADLAGSPE